MYLLDTNILSELMAKRPSQNVLQWFDQQNTLELFTSTITLAEISYGLQCLPEGHRRSLLETRFGQFTQLAFKSRILYFDEQSAFIYGQLMAHCRSIGKPMSVCDGQIAAIAKRHYFNVVTRNVRDFENCGLILINPFDS